jgi:hypothetical protein
MATKHDENNCDVCRVMGNWAETTDTIEWLAAHRVMGIDVSIMEAPKGQAVRDVLSKYLKENSVTGLLLMRRVQYDYLVRDLQALVDLALNTATEKGRAPSADEVKEVILQAKNVSVTVDEEVMVDGVPLSIAVQEFLRKRPN